MKRIIMSVFVLIMMFGAYEAMGKAKGNGKGITKECKNTIKQAKKDCVSTKKSDIAACKGLKGTEGKSCRKDAKTAFKACKDAAKNACDASTSTSTNTTLTCTTCKQNCTTTGATCLNDSTQAQQAAATAKQAAIDQCLPGCTTKLPDECGKLKTVSDCKAACDAANTDCITNCSAGVEYGACDTCVMDCKTAEAAKPIDTTNIKTPAECETEKTTCVDSGCKSSCTSTSGTGTGTGTSTGTSTTTAECTPCANGASSKCDATLLAKCQSGCVECQNTKCSKDAQTQCETAEKAAWDASRAELKAKMDACIGDCKTKYPDDLLAQTAAGNVNKECNSKCTKNDQQCSYSCYQAMMGSVQNNKYSECSIGCNKFLIDAKPRDPSKCSRDRFSCIASKCKLECNVRTSE